MTPGYVRVKLVQVFTVGLASFVLARGIHKRHFRRLDGERRRERLMVSARNVADYLILKAAAEGRALDQLTLQKLVSYAQAFHLAAHDCQLFANNVEAWKYGPAVMALYAQFGRYGAGPIDVSEAKNPVVDQHASRWLDEVWGAFKHFTGVQLANMTHREEPYREAYSRARDPEHSREVIAPIAMRDYYRENYEPWQPGYGALMEQGYRECAAENVRIARELQPAVHRAIRA